MKESAEKARMYLSDSAPESCFWLCDGQILKSMEDLSRALKSMNDDVFRYHVNEAKNDFANWIRNILKDQELANNMSKVRDRSRAASIVESRLSSLKRMAPPSSKKSR